MARQYLRFTPETTWGTYNSSGTATIIQLDQNNAFTMRPAPINWTIRSAGGFNRRVQRGTAKTSVAGILNTLCYGSQMAAFAPWLFASSSNVLESVTIDHAIVMDDTGSTTVYRRYLGVMVNQVQITSGEADQLMRMQIQMTGKQPAVITSTDFPEPLASAYPNDAPYVFEMVSGGFTLGTSRLELEEFNLTVNNHLDPRFMASQYLTRLKYCGRDVDFDVRFPYITTVDRTDFEAQSPVTGLVVFTNGSHSMTFTLDTQNYIAQCNDDLALDKVHLQTLHVEDFFDASASPATDLTVAVV
jgi:hypothetical protein